LQLRLYTWLSYLLLPFALLYLLWRGLGDRDYLRRWPERLGRVAAVAGERPLLWLHAASVGEVQAALPLLQALARAYPDHRQLVTTVTPGGSRIVQARCARGTRHCYLPYDVPLAVEAFLRHTRPCLGIIMETELWPQLFLACRRRTIPLVIANAGISARSYTRYRLLRGLCREVLQAVSLVAAESRQQAERFIALGADPAGVQVVGNTKFDVIVPAEVPAAAEELRHRLLGARPVWVAASTHEGEEAALLRALLRVRREHPDALLVLAPRHPPRCRRVARACIELGCGEVVLRSAGRACTPATTVFLLDTLGELLPFYATAELAFIGGSLVPVGGHNPLEAAALGVPLVVGPYHDNYAAMVEMLVADGACWVADDEHTLAARVSQLLGDATLRRMAAQRARALVAHNRGSVERLVDLLPSPLTHPPP